MTMTATNQIPAGMSDDWTSPSRTTVLGDELVRLFSNAALFMGEAEHPSIHGVLLTVPADASPTVQATNRYVLFRETMGLGLPVGEWFIDGAQVKAIIAVGRSAKRGGVVEVFTADEGRRLVFSCVASGQAVTVGTVEFGFPPVDSLRNSQTPGPVEFIGLNPTQLALIAKIRPQEDASNRKGDRFTAVRFAFGGSELRAATFTVGKYVDGLVMPVRLP